MKWISVKDKLPNDGEIVRFMSEASAGTTKYEKGDFEYNRRTDEFASMAKMGTADKVLKWAKK